MPVRADDTKAMLEIIAAQIIAPIRAGVNQIVIHSDGSGNVVKIEHKTVIR